jgi:hypothetical protein
MTGHRAVGWDTRMTTAFVLSSGANPVRSTWWMLRGLADDGATPNLIVGSASARSTVHGSRPGWH